MTAIKATFSDFKLIKTRKVAQLILEVPIEQANAALAALGGVPQFDSEQWVGIAPISQEAASRGEVEVPPSKKEITLAQRAGMLCQDGLFQKFILQGVDKSVLEGSTNISESAANALRYECDVVSRADIKEGTSAGEAFSVLLTEYDAWRGRIGRP